jgi:hypothetical protein
MDAERGRRADALFHAALPLGAAERRAFLEAACADDLGLAAEISDRLASAHPSEPLRPTAADSPSEQTSPGVPPREVSTGPLSAATQWGGLRLIAPLGRGGFGRVYRAWDDGLAREVALKIIPVRQPGRADLLREGQMLARVRHPNVVIVHAVQQIGNEVGLTMELIEGRTLAEDVRQNGPRGADEAIAIGLRVCQALAAVHGVRLLHRDVKAQNVMREAGGRIVLMDFGAGRDVDGTGRHHEVVGTPLYLAPELLTGGLATPASDLYGVGVLLFYLVTGKYPVEGASMLDVIEMHRQGKRRRLADLRPDLPPRFIRVVERALATTPNQPYQSAGEMITDLADAVEHPPAANRRADTPSADSDEIAPTPAPATLVLRGLLGLLAVPLLGALTCAQYDRMIARTADFTTEGPSDWTYWGFKALQTPAIYVTMLAFLVWATGALWHLLQRLAPPLGRANERARSLLLRTTSRLTGANPAGTAEMLLAFQVLCVVFGIVVFYKLIFAMMLTVEAQYPAWLDVLDPESHLLLSYRVTLTSMLAVMAVGWFRLLRPPVWRAAIPRATIAAGIATMVLFLLAISVPYRAFYKSEAPQITYRGRPCFQTGVSADKQRTLLYCPGATTTVLTTTMSDPNLTLTGGTMKRIFSRDLAAAKQ